MSSICSIASRAVWAFIILAGVLVAVVITTDHPLAWRLMSVPGFVVLGLTSVWVGATLWNRETGTAQRKARVAEPQAPRVAEPQAPRVAEAQSPRVAEPEPPLVTEAITTEPDVRAPKITPRRPFTEPQALRSEPAVAGKRKQVRTPLPEPRQPLSRPAPRVVVDAWQNGPRLTRDVPEPPHPKVTSPSEASGVVTALAPVPIAAVSGEGQFRRPVPCGDAAVDACFEIGAYSDEAETRDADIPALQEAEALRGDGNRAEALTRMGEILAEYPDYAPLYLRLAELLHEAGRPDARDTILEKGLEAARSKAEILAAIGDYAVYEGRLADALPWLLRSAALQLGGGASQAPGAFSLLSGLCDPHATLSRARLWLLKEAAARDEAGDYRLDEVAKGRLHLLSKTQTQGWMIAAIERLWRFYAPEAPATAPPVLLLKPRNSPSRAEHHHRPRALL